MENGLRVLGLTGGIASGKSTVARMFSELGAVVVNADELAREVVAPGSATLAAVVREFGPGVLRPDGSLDREGLGRRVFADGTVRRRLEALLHPAIRELSESRLAALRRSAAPLIIYEAPLLFEAGAETRVDAVLVVTVSEAEQLRRLVERDRFSEAEARARMAAQMPQAEKVARADWLIDSDCSLEVLQGRVADLYARLTART